MKPKYKSIEHFCKIHKNWHSDRPAHPYNGSKSNLPKFYNIYIYIYIYIFDPISKNYNTFNKTFHTLNIAFTKDRGCCLPQKHQKVKFLNKHLRSYMIMWLVYILKTTLCILQFRSNYSEAFLKSSPYPWKPLSATLEALNLQCSK